MMAALAEGARLEYDALSIMSDADLYSLSDVDSEATEDYRSILESEEQYTAAQQATAKAIEAAQEGSSTQSTASTSRPPSLAPSRASTSAASTFWYHPPRRNRRNSSPGPPDYDEAITQAAYVPSRIRYRNSDAASLDVESQHGSKRSCMSRWRRHWKRLCLLNLAVYCLVVTAVIVVKWMLTDPTMSVEQRLRPDWALAENFHTNMEECHVEAAPEFHYFEWDSLSNFSFSEAMHPITRDDSREVRVSGKLEIRPAPYNQKSSLYAIVSTASSNDWSSGTPELQRDSDGLRLTLSQPAVPSFHSHHDLKRRHSISTSCLNVWVGIYVRDPTKNWNLQTNSMDIAIGRQSVHDGVPRFSMAVEGTTRISSRSGNIDVVHLDSREASIGSESGQIAGTYALRDELHLQTDKGDIAVEIERQAHHDRIQSSASTLHPAANFSTTTISGDQAVRLLQPLKGQVWSGSSYGYTYPVHSHHKSKTGQIQILSNNYWEGTVKASSTDGSIDLRGPDLVLVPTSNRDPTHRSSHATKGAEDSTMVLRTTRGAIDVCIDDLEKC